MLGRTHMMIGVFVGTAMELHTPGIGVLEGAAIGALGGLMPDLDHPNSTLTRKVIPVSILSRSLTMAIAALAVIKLAYDGWLPAQSFVGIAIYLLIAALAPHRGITHSLLGLLLATYGLHNWLGNQWFVFACAYASHLVADMLTDGGVPLLWPILKDFRVPTGLHTGRFFTRLLEGGIQLFSLYWIVWNLKDRLPTVVSFITNFKHHNFF